MKIQTPIEFQTFNDGVCTVYSVGNIAALGNRPKDGLTVKLRRVPYERRKLGVTRYYTAKQAGVKVDDVIRIPRNTSVSSQDVCALEDGAQYQVRQVQHIGDTLPPSTDLTLQRLEAVYDIAGVP